MLNSFNSHILNTIPNLLAFFSPLFSMLYQTQFLVSYSLSMSNSNSHSLSIKKSILYQTCPKGMDESGKGKGKILFHSFGRLEGNGHSHSLRLIDSIQNPIFLSFHLIKEGLSIPSKLSSCGPFCL